MTKKSSMTFRARRMRQINVKIINFKNRFEIKHARINELISKLFLHINHVRVDIHVIVIIMIMIIVKMLIVAIVLRFDAFL